MSRSSVNLSSGTSQSYSVGFDSEKLQATVMPTPRMVRKMTPKMTAFGRRTSRSDTASTPDDDAASRRLITEFRFAFFLKLRRAASTSAAASMACGVFSLSFSFSSIAPGADGIPPDGAASGLTLLDRDSTSCQ